MSRADSLDNAFLEGIRILEFGDELGEYAGRLLAGLGADVVKVEPPGGEVTRGYGPFLQGKEGVDRSLHFWHYNLGKRSVVINCESSEGREHLRRLVEKADVVLDARVRPLSDLGLGYEVMSAWNPDIVVCRISPFGDDGPWAGFKGSDLVHLALGGVMMNCGYDPEPGGHYDTSPVAPQMWQAYQITGEMAVLGIMAAIAHRQQGGPGQRLSVAVHEAVSLNTESDVPNWIFSGLRHYRQTCRHSLPAVTVTSLVATKDGRYVLPYKSYLNDRIDSDRRMRDVHATIELLKKFGVDVAPILSRDMTSEEVKEQLAAKVDSLVGSYRYDKDLWVVAQNLGLAWAPIRRPDENLADAHWWDRGAFTQVAHEELAERFVYVTGRWVSPGVPWRTGPRPPLLGEHTDEARAGWREPSRLMVDAATAKRAPVQSSDDRADTAHARRFPLAGVSVVDLSWLLASGGAARYLAALGADVIKVEHESHPDSIRWGAGHVSDEKARDHGGTASPGVSEWRSPNRSGCFLDYNAGKRSMSLDIKSPEGREILIRLISAADIVVEGFSSGTLERLGFGYEQLKEIKPDIIYVQQSGMGYAGKYFGFKSYGPTAQAISGLSEMSGFPAPWPPAGIGYSYLDWFGAYNVANAMMAALVRKRRTGLGCHIDASQAEVGIYLTGSTILNRSANGVAWERYGNDSPYKLAAPHGVFRVAGTDRWLALGCFTQREWEALAEELQMPELVTDPRFDTLEARRRQADLLHRLISEKVAGQDGDALMLRLQTRGVPAGMCQTAEDRCERDPQLRHLGWMVDLKQTEIGTWPSKNFPVKFSRTSARTGGVLERHGPNYGEDTRYVLEQMLGMTKKDIERLRDRKVI